MKSVLQAAWLLTVAFGNLIVIIVAEAKAFDDQVRQQSIMYTDKTTVCMKIQGGGG